MARLDPRSAVTEPTKNAPIKAPIELIDPNELICEFVNGDDSGVFGEVKIGNAGENHPSMVPCDNASKFTVKCSITLLYFNVLEKMINSTTNPFQLPAIVA